MPRSLNLFQDPATNETMPQPTQAKTCSEGGGPSLEFLTTPDDTSKYEGIDVPSSVEKLGGVSDMTTSEWPIIKPWTLALITLSLAFGTFLVALDTTIVGIAVPTITSQFHSLDDIAWYGSAYLITLTALQPSFGRVYSIYKTKATYLTCVSIFEAGSILCAVAPNSLVFIFGRAIAGCGAAGLFQGALNIITNIVPLEKRPLFMGIVVSVFGVSACVGPVLGGILTKNASWRWCFWINVPIGAVTFILVLIFLKLRENKQSKRQALSMLEQVKQMDPIGACTIIAAVVCLFLALQWGGQSKPWNSATIIGLFIGSGFLFAAFCLTQYIMGENATIPLRVLKQRSILFGALFLFSMAMSAYVYGYYLPIYFQTIKGSSPTKSGVQFMTIALPQIVAIIATGAIATQWGYYVPYIVLGNVINLIGSGLLITLDANTSTVKWATYMVITGIGTGFGVNLPYTAVQVVLEEEDIPTGNAISQFAYQLGAAIGLSIGQAIFIKELTSQIAGRTSLLSPAEVISAGASGLKAIAPNPSTMKLLIESYSNAIRSTMIFALATVGLAFIVTFGIENRSAKDAAKKSKTRTDEVPLGAHV